MRVQSFKRICTNPQLEALVHKKSKIKSRTFAERLVKENKEPLFHLFLDSIYTKRSSHDAKRLFKAFIKEFDKLPDDKKRALSDPFHKELEKVRSVFIKQTKACDARFEESDFTLEELETIVQELHETNYARAKKEEEEVNKQSLRNKEICRGVANFQAANDKAYPHSVIQLDESPKMVIIGTPRLDRKNTLRDFFSIMIKEDVDVIVTLNTPEDWEEAIPYYEHEHVESLQISGYTIEREVHDHILYEGKEEANMPQGIKRMLSHMSDTTRLTVESKYLPRIIERVFWIKENAVGSWRKITQLHYENWPDRREAPDLDAWWALLQRQLELTSGSIAIHCQGGIGRTNAHAILSCLISQLKAANNEVFNVPRTMFRLKEQAPRLGGVICAKRFGQIYEMLQRFYST